MTWSCHRGLGLRLGDQTALSRVPWGGLAATRPPKEDAPREPTERRADAGGAARSRAGRAPGGTSPGAPGRHLQGGPSEAPQTARRSPPPVRGPRAVGGQRAAGQALRKAPLGRGAPPQRGQCVRAWGRAWGRVWGRELLPGMGARARGPCRRKGSSSGGGGEPWGAVGSLGNGCRGGRL